MQKMKKWIALVCAVSALVTLLVPLNSLAAEGNEAVLNIEESGQAELAGGSGQTRAAAQESFSAYITKDDSGVVETNLESTEEEVDAVVLVGDSRLSLELQVLAGDASYRWSRSLEAEDSGRPIPVEEIPAAENQPTYTVSTGNGDLQQVGIYTYVCQPLDANGNDDGQSVSFTVKTLGAGLELANGSQEEAPAMLVSEATAGNENLKLQVRLNEEEVNDIESRVNIPGLTVAEPTLPRGRGVYTWTSAQLGSSFDAYPYDKSDDAGAEYDYESRTAWFQLLVAYDGGETYANQVAPGANSYTATAEGAGIDPARNSVTFTRTVIPQLAPQPEANEGYESSVDGNQATYTYYTQALSVDGRVLAKWQMSLVPSGVRYHWTQIEEGTATEDTTSNRFYEYEIQSPASKDVQFICEPVGGAFQGLNLTDAQKEQVRAVFNVRVQKDVPDPSISSVSAELANGKEVDVVLAPESTQAYQVQVPRGNDLILTADANAGANVGGVVTYQWTHFDGNHENPTQIAASTAGFVLEENGQKLRIVNPQLEIDRTWLQLTVTNRGGKTTTRSIRLMLGSPLAPIVSLSSDPEAVNSVLSLSENTPFELKVAEANGISEESLSYTWMRTTAANHNDPELWTPLAEGSGNPLSLTATRSLNDVPVYYKCVVTNTSGSGDSLTADTGIIAVQVNPTTGVVSIVEPKQAVYKEISHGSDNRVVFGVEAKIDTDAAIGYQWYMVKAEQGAPAEIYETDRISGAQESTYTPGRIPDPGYYVYKCKVYNQAEPSQYVWSPEFQLLVLQEAEVPMVTTVGERNLGVVAGGYVRLRVEAYTASGEVLSYQWEQSSGSDWQDIPDGVRKSITLSNLTTAQSGTQYRCRVTNLRQGTTNYSDIFTVKVWRQEDMPVILTQPKGWTLQSGTVESSRPTLQAVVELSGNNRYVFNWERWDADKEEWVSSDLEQLDVNTDETAASTLEFPNTNENNGRYRCQIINRGGNPADATIYTNEVEVRIMMRNVPTILHAPKSQSAMVGKTVTLRVNATIFPEEELLYTWRVKEPGSSSWRNCNDSDGSGYRTPTFISKVYTGSDIGQTYEYYCVVEGAVNHVRAPESTKASVVVYPEYPELDVAPTSKLTIKQDEETGERLLRGYVASRSGLILTVKGVREDVIARNMDGTGGRYTLEVRDPQGNLLKKDGDQVTTGCSVTLLLTNEPGSEDTPIAADELTIVILGDIQGTGRMSIGQLVTMANYLIGDKDIPAGPQREATDINGNGKCDIGDLTMAAQLLQQEP